MPALPSSTSLIAGSTTVVNSRGTIGAYGSGAGQSLNVTVRYDYEQMLHTIFSDLRFFDPSLFIQVKIPRNQNERVFFEVRDRGDFEVYPMNEAGRILGGAGSRSFDPNIADSLTGTDLSALEGAEIPSGTLSISTVEAVVKRYASIYRYTAVAQSTAKHDPVEWAIEEMGLVVAQQLDALVKGLFDAYAQDLYPSSTVTADNDNDWTTSMTFDYPAILRLEAHLQKAGVRAPKGRKNFPMIIPVDAQQNLLLDSTTRQLILDTATREDVMASVLKKGFIGTLRCFDFYVCNALANFTQTKADASTFVANRAYIFSDEAVACLSMEDPTYGVLPSGTQSPDGPHFGDQWGWDTMPQPVKVNRVNPTPSAADWFGQLGAAIEMHTASFTIVRASRIFRFMFAINNSGNSTTVGAAVAAATGSRSLTTGHTSGAAGVAI